MPKLFVPAKDCSNIIIIGGSVGYLLKKKSVVFSLLVLLNLTIPYLYAASGAASTSNSPSASTSTEKQKLTNPSNTDKKTIQPLPNTPSNSQETKQSNPSNPSNQPTVTINPSPSENRINAVDNRNRPIEPLIEGYYPPYPPIQPAQNVPLELVNRGEYLAKMGDCIACHTNVKGKTPAFAGGLPLETPFGTFYSPNITPDKETGIGQWTEEDFIRALKKGRDPHGRNYFPVFPYIYFAKMTDDDARALYAYFMSIPPVKLKNKSLPFPFGVPGARFSLWGWNLLFFYPEKPSVGYDADKTPLWNRGKYIVDSLGHCSMCHTPLNIFGAPKNRYYLTGSFIDGYWAPNITRYGLHAATRYEVADVFAQGKLINKAGPVAGPMAEVNHNSLSYLSEDDRLAIATYLKSVVSEEPYGVTASEDKPTLARGKQVYINSCILCHQQGQMGAPVIGNGDNWFLRLKTSGITGLYRHAIYGYNSMPVKGACVTCSDNDLISAVDYILNASLSRSQWLDVASAGPAKYPSNGQAIYNENCGMCHNDGKQGAPKLGDKAIWKPIIAKNIDVLVESTIHGDYHPKNAGCKECTTGEILEAIKYMVSQSKSEGNYSLW